MQLERVLYHPDVVRLYGNIFKLTIFTYRYIFLPVYRAQNACSQRSLCAGEIVVIHGSVVVFSPFWRIHGNTGS